MDFKGCITAIITPFNSKSQVDYQGLKENIEFQIKNGVSGLVPLGTTGEAPTIEDDERTKIIETSIESIGKRVPTIIGTGTNSTSKTIEYTKEAEKLGADAVLIMTPYYNKPTQEGIYRHFEAITKATDIPIIVYNIASRTGTNITTPTMLRLSGLDNICGVKEASGDLSQIKDVIEQLPKDFNVLSGDDNMTLPVISSEGRGVISVVSNLLPRRVSDMVNAALSGDLKRASSLNDELMPIFKGAFIESNPIPIKTAMRMAGMPSGIFRLPMCEMNSHNAEKLKKILQTYNELEIR